MNNLQFTMYNFKKIKQQGLTLVEILVAMGIATMVGVLLLVIITNSAGIFYQQLPKVQQGLNINDALSLIRSNIKQANAVVVSYTNGVTVYTAGSTQLILKVASIDSSGNIISNTFDYFVFFLDQGWLRFKTFPDPLGSRKAEDRVLSNQVEFLLFQYFNKATPPLEVLPAEATNVKITIVLKQKAGAGYETNTATSEASLRND